MVLCVCLNAGIDKTFVLDDFALRGIYRPREVLTYVGGKGVNLARVLRTLGVDCLAMGMLGGHAGDLCRELLDAEGIRHDFTRPRREARYALCFVCPARGVHTEVNELGPEISEEELGEVLDKYRSYLPKASFVAICGSAPPGAPADIYCTMVNQARERGVPVLLDVSRQWLVEGARGLPDYLKPNVVELAQLLQADPDLREAEMSIEEAGRAAQELCRRGMRAVVVTLGGKGALATDGERVYHAWAPAAEVKSAIGSGDALAAGFIERLVAGAGLAEALRRGVACGAANATVYGAGFCTRESIAAHEGSVDMREIDV